ncbi:type II toxin-antitoxin system VapC family toxin [Candidatus Palauibacter sp.]|uniref:type II toxin-antitoxin system VapC family toxin n=1 Tax=Candidatus Palauibacter sp. TaxID=3101350 RepID=UPI003AF2CE9F
MADIWSTSPTATRSTARWKRSETLVFDTNVLVYAVNEDSEFHVPCLRQLDEARLGPARTFLTWSVCYEFLRAATHPSVMQSPRRATAAWRFLSELLESPGIDLLTATRRHGAVLARTVEELPHISGNRMHDLHIAVLMREHGISRICTRDAGFRHFPFLSVVDPVA